MTQGWEKKVAFSGKSKSVCDTLLGFHFRKQQMRSWPACRALSSASFGNSTVNNSWWLVHGCQLVKMELVAKCKKCKTCKHGLAFICYYHLIYRLIRLVWFQTLNRTTCCLHWSAIAWQIILGGRESPLLRSWSWGFAIFGIEILHRIHPVFHLIGNSNELGPTKVVDPQIVNQHWVLTTC